MNHRRPALFHVLAGAILAAFAWRAPAGWTDSTSAPALAITRANVWTPRGVLADHDVLVRGGRISALGPHGTLRIPGGTREIRGRGHTLLPGLIDSHVHFSLSLGTRLPSRYTPAEIQALTAKQLLRSGVTYGRVHLMDIVSGPALKKLAASDVFPSPRIQLGGPGFFGGQPEWDSPTGNVWGVKDVDDATAKVRRVKDAGGDWIALHQVRRFLPGELEAIVAEAGRIGIRLMAGGDLAAEAERALDAGVDSVEYVDRTESPRYADAFVAKVRGAGPGTFLVPPIGFPFRFLEYRRDAGLLDDPTLLEFMPLDLKEGILTALREARTKSSAQEKALAVATAGIPEKFRQLRASGVPVVLGTDCGSEAHFQANAIWIEMEAWRRLGVSPDEIVRAGTEIPARALRQTDIGHLDPGARADFVLYRGSIDEGPFSAARVGAVAKGGVIVVENGLWVGPR
jgi:imidazolonepropionase-like amidohydrolase